MKPIDIFITAYLRAEYTRNTIQYLKERTSYPFRLFLIDQGENGWVPDHFSEMNIKRISYGENVGIHLAWNTAMMRAESEYFITTDNDILVPELRGLHKDQPDWLSQLVKFMDERPDYGAISLHPHIFIGINGEDPNDPEDVKEAPMAGAVMRIMRRDAVRKVGGWDQIVEAGRNHEERTISSRLRDNEYKVGRTTRIRAWHEFGDNWGYPKEFTPEMQKHNPELNDYVNQFNNKDAYDLNTWLPK